MLVNVEMVVVFLLFQNTRIPTDFNLNVNVRVYAY